MSIGEGSIVEKIVARRGIGNILAPWRFITFAVILSILTLMTLPSMGWSRGVMMSFDVAALVFLTSCVPLLNGAVDEMRMNAKQNDANRALLLAIAVVVMVVIMIAVASELMHGNASGPLDIGLIICTLSMSWLFTHTLYALHYAHLFYTSDKEGKDSGGLEFPGTKEPDYWDFAYFSFCLGMTFQTSDTEMTSRQFRRVSTFHCLAAFVFNIGVIAFTINVLGAK